MEKIIINKKISTSDDDYIVAKFKEYRDIDYIDIEIAIEFKKNNSNKVIIILPGNGGSSKGYNDKYYKIVDLFSKDNYASVLCLDNKTQMGLSNKMISLLKIETAINEVLSNPLKFSNSNKPDIYLIGFSDGGSIVGSIAFHFPQIIKILLISPSLLVGIKTLNKLLPKYKGSVYIIIGENDEVVGVDSGKYFYNTFKCEKKILIIPNCNHKFDSENNFNLFINAPIYAFKDGNGVLFEDLLLK